MSIDAAHWSPERSQYTFRALFIPAHPYDQVRLVDLGTAVSANVRALIGCRLIDKVTIEAAGAVSADFLFDEEGALVDDPQLNELANLFGQGLKLAQAVGRYPAPAGMSLDDLAEATELWRRYVRLVGPVVIVGADERTGQWVPVPDRLIEFAATALSVEEPTA